MPESGEGDGIVKGPLRQGCLTVTTIIQNAPKVSLGTPFTDNSGKILISTEKTDSAVASDLLPVDFQKTSILRATVAEVCYQLSSARASQIGAKQRAERLCAQLLKDGERIPALDQRQFSLAQEAYLNASTAAIIAAENIAILREQIASLEAELARLSTMQVQDDNGLDYLKAA